LVLRLFHMLGEVVTAKVRCMVTLRYVVMKVWLRMVTAKVCDHWWCMVTANQDT
jgi:hypothetical protein